MTTEPFPVLYEDNHLLAVSKPAMLPTMGVPSDRPSLLSMAKTYIKRKYSKPGNVYLGTVSRLDAPVTGIVLFARTSKAAARLASQFRNRTVEKIYWAVVDPEPSPSSGTRVDWLLKHERHRRMVAVDTGNPDAQQARLSYETLANQAQGWLVRIRLETGRKHQIRVQFSQLGSPVLGDRKYGSPHRFPVGIALHARQLTIQHPVRSEPLVLRAPLPQAWKHLGIGEQAGD